MRSKARQPPGIAAHFACTGRDGRWLHPARCRARCLGSFPSGVGGFGGVELTSIQADAIHERDTARLLDIARTIDARPHLFECCFHIFFLG